jgi:Leucine-rich repeat (LRR) protein
MIELENLDLSWNRLTKINHKTFSKLTKLKSLDISNNKIEMNSKNVIEISKIQSMDITFFDYEQYDENEMSF